MSTVNRVVKNTLFLYARMGTSIVVSVLTTRILLDALGASDYGLYNVVAGALAMLGFLSASMSTASLRYMSYAEGKGDITAIQTIFNSSVRLHRMLALLVCGLYIIAGFFLFNGILNIPSGRETTAMIVYGCLIFSTVFSITITPYDAVLNAHENMFFYSLVGIIDVFLKLTIAVLVSYSDYDRLLFYGLLMAGESWLLRFITKCYCDRTYPVCRAKSIKGHDNEILKKMASFAGWNMLNICAGMISLYGMTIAINHFFGTLLNAALGIATQLQGALMGVSGNMSKALTPVLVKKEGANQRHQMLEISYAGCKFSFLLFSFFALPILFSMPVVLQLWLKEVPEWTVLFCMLWFVSGLIEQLYHFLYQAIQAEGNIKRFNICSSIANIIPIILTCVEFQSGFQPYWAILNWIIFRIMVDGIIYIYFAHKLIGLSVLRWIKYVLIPCLASFVCISCIYWRIRPQVSDSLLVQLSLLIIMFIISLPVYWYVALSRNDRHVFSSIVTNMRRRKSLY